MITVLQIDFSYFHIFEHVADFFYLSLQIFFEILTHLVNLRKTRFIDRPPILLFHYMNENPEDVFFVFIFIVFVKTWPLLNNTCKHDCFT